jgi:phenylacetate-coenzyme A ligase PaaK-like adenylate-forming protein
MNKTITGLNDMGLINFLRNYCAASRNSALSEDRLFKIQEQRFRRLLTYTVKHSEFYKDLYSGIDVESCRLQDLPIVTKSTMMGNFDRFVTDSRLKFQEIKEWIADKKNYGKLYLDEFYTIPTSGSSGEFALVIYHYNAINLIQASLFARHPLEARPSFYNQLKILATQLLGSKVRIAVIVPLRGNIAAIVNPAPPFHHLFANIKLLSLFDSEDLTIKALNEFQPDCLFSTSFFLGILAQEQLAGNLKIAFNRPMSFIAGGAEPLTEQIKKLTFKAWNRRVQDDYGAAECFFMASSCPKFGNLHVMNDLCILEVVDGNYNTVPPGQYGEKVLVTNLTNCIQPVIRYEIEDVAGYADRSCECGLPFPTLLSVQGRKSDFLYFQKPNKEYEKFHPYRFRIPLYYMHELFQYQIVQTARNELTFLYVSQKDAINIESRLLETLEEALRKAGLESRVVLKLRRVETIPRNERSGKFQIVKSLGAPSEINSTANTDIH